MYPTIHTPLLTLIPLEPAHAEVLHCLYQTEDVLRYFPTRTPPPLEKVQRFIHSQMEHWDKYGYGNWGMLPEGENQIVGWAGLQFLPELDETEVGYLLDQPFWGKGFASEAARVSIQYGFEKCKLDHIIALVHPENLASRRVIEKNGLTYMETIHLWGIDLMRYRLNASSWKANVSGETAQST